MRYFAMHRPHHMPMIRPARLLGSASLRSYSLASNPFTTTSNYSNYQADEQTLRENMAAVPSPPEHHPELHIYNHIVKPGDACDLFFRPSVNDIIVTSLAKSCAIHSDSLYKLVSKSTVSDAKLAFANITIQWMNEFEKGINPLTNPPEKKAYLAYNSVAVETLLVALFDESVASSEPKLAHFYSQAAAKDVSIDLATKFLLPRLKTALEYDLVINYLEMHCHELNPRTLKEFLALLLEDLSSNATLERVEKFDGFFTDKLMLVNPNLLKELDPATLAHLAYVTTFSSTLSTSRQALSILVDTYKAAPSKLTFELFMSRYRKSSLKENYSKEKILQDLAPLKSIMHHYGLSVASFDFFLKSAITHTQDLSNFVKFVKETSAAVLSQRGPDVMGKLKSLQLNESKPAILRKLQRVQLAKLLIAEGCEPQELEI